MSDKPFLALCDCGAETVKVSLFVEPDKVEGYVTFSSWWDQRRRWSERLRACWTILRGKSHYFSEVILDREDTERLQWYLAGQLQQSVHVDFTSVTHGTGASRQGD